MYNFGAGAERSNLEIAQAILKRLNLKSDRIEFIEDRKGHDFRYSVTFAKAQKELGFAPKVNFDEGMSATIDWYLSNEHWWRRALRR